ncbi:MAG: class I SAM-dependent methyltransferase [Calditrichaeota bacterium]|nr:class I SAM-dependent methyltransferase [Calditrichota bacterium]
MTGFHDEHTVRYFDEQTPIYDVQSMRDVVDLINEHKGGRISLLDIGCGTGNNLHHIGAQTGLTDLMGVDISANCLKIMSRDYGISGLLASVLDDDLDKQISRKFDFILLAVILHHLIGGSRRESMELASQAVGNALKLLKPDGRLIIMERMYYPPVIDNVAFHVKKIVTRWTSGRIHLIGHHVSNIGAPVVSYFSEAQLLRIVEKENHCQVVASRVFDMWVPWYLKVLGLWKTEARTYLFEAE